MKVTVEMKNGDCYKGVIRYKDDAFLFLNVESKAVKVMHWDLVRRIYRLLKGKEVDINISKYGTGVQ